MNASSQSVTRAESVEEYGSVGEAGSARESEFVGEGGSVGEGRSAVEVGFVGEGRSAGGVKQSIRSAMRARRAGLGRDVVAAAGVAVAERLLSLKVIVAASRVAAYRAVRGELPLDALTEGERWADFTFPRVVGNDLEFVARYEGQRFAPGSFAIPEPVDGDVVALADHDVVLVPLTAFDARCHRVGQGGGFYDRALSAAAGTGREPTRHGVSAAADVGRPRPVTSAAAGAGRARPVAIADADVGRARPVAIGIAYSFQQVDKVPVEPWDVALDGIVTDDGYFESADRRLCEQDSSPLTRGW